MIAVLTALTMPAQFQAAAVAPAPADSAHALPSGLELLHITPPGQPPLHSIDIDNFDELRSAFNASSDRVRVMLLVSGTCPHCLHGATLIQQVLAESTATPMHVFVVWMHVTRDDRVPANGLALAKVTDPRAEQWWDPRRLVSKAMMSDYPADTAMAMADTTGGQPPLIWDFVAMWKPRTKWGEKIPMPDFAAHPIELYVAPFRQQLGELSRPGPK